MSETAVVDGGPAAFFFGNERCYGLFDPESASRHGYNAPPELLQSGGKGGWDPSEDELFLVRGSGGSFTPTDENGQPFPDGGCIGEANRILLSGVPEQLFDEALPDVLSLESHELSEADSRVREVIEQWSECMERSGHGYGTVWEPNNQDWLEPVTEEEIAGRLYG